MSNDELLRRYLREDSQAAFALLVSRHIDLVYSAALRQVRQPDLAEEVAQAVFVDLARQARTLPDDQPVSAWLYVVTRRTAIDVVRREVRRRAGEEAAALLATMRTESTGWTEIAAVLDEAMATLDPADRSAILLRYFENLSLREVGASLGISEDTAQKRLSRALDRLRTAFARRGVAISTTAFVAELSAHAVRAAPVGLGTTISTATALSGAAGAVATAEATNAIAMTTLQKAIVGTMLAVVLGTGLYEARLLAHQTDELARRSRESADLAGQFRQERERQAVLASQLQSVERTIDARLADPPRDARLEAQARAWLGKIDRLKQALAADPRQRIPEMALLTDRDWFENAEARELGELRTPDEIATALSRLRSTAEREMMLKIRDALVAYLAVHNDYLPDRVGELLPFFDPPIDPSWLERYEMWESGKANPTPRLFGPLGVKTPLDVERDVVWSINGTSVHQFPAMETNIDYAAQAFHRANSERFPPTSEALLPFLRWPAPPAAVEKQWQNSPWAKLKPTSP